MYLHNSGTMTLSTRGACLTQSSTFLSRIISSAQDSRPLKWPSCWEWAGGSLGEWKSPVGIWGEVGSRPWMVHVSGQGLPDTPTRLFPNLPSPATRPPLPPRGLFSPLPQPYSQGLSYTLPPFVSSHPAPSAASEDPFRTLPAPCKGRGVFRTPCSCPQTGVSQKVPVRAELKISPGSRWNPDPDQESRAVPAGLGGKGEGLWEQELGWVSRRR